MYFQVDNHHMKSQLNASGKHLKSKDIQNLKQRMLQSHREGRNVVPVLVDELKAMTDNDAGLKHS